MAMLSRNKIINAADIASEFLEKKYTKKELKLAEDKELKSIIVDGVKFMCENMGFDFIDALHVLKLFKNCGYKK